MTLLLSPSGIAQADVLTSRNDNNRTGANLNEGKLTANNVNASSFGFLFSYSVQGNIFAQPLLVNGVQTPIGVRNVLYVATSNNVLYAFDADGVSQNGGLIWKDCFVAATPVQPVTSLSACPSGPASFIPASDPVYDGVFEGSIGITGTPVIDRSRNALYLVTRSKYVDGNYEQSLHAIDIGSGTERTGSPVVIAHAPLTQSHSITTFAAFQNQRAGLGLAGDRVVVAWGGGTREGSGVSGLPVAARYRGYVIAFDAVSLKPTGCFSAMGERGADLSNGTHGAAIWQSGRAPVIDQNGYVYYQTGNTLSNADDENPCSFLALPWVHSEGLANSLIKLDVAHGNTLASSIAPQEILKQALDDCDLDLSGSGPLLIPGTSTLIGGGKQGFLHVFEKREANYIEGFSRQVYDGPREQYVYAPDANDPTHLRCSTVSENKLCTGLAQGCHHIMAGPVYWDSASKGKLIYVSAENDDIKAFRFEPSGHTLIQYDDDLLIPAGNLPLIMRTSRTVVGHPGANLSISAHANIDGTGVLWAVHTLPRADQHDFFRSQMAGILRAYDAQDLAHELWNSEICPDDELGNFPKFTPPTIANGRVYAATFSGKLMVYGLRTRPANCLLPSPPHRAIP